MELNIAAGFLGTVWGVSQSVFSSFGGQSGVTTEHLKSLFDNFSGGLKTALDTTVLGLVCSVIITLIMTGTYWMETNALQALTAQVCSQLSLETALHNREGELWQKLQARWSTLVEPLVQGLGEPLVRETGAALQAMVAQTLQLYEAKLNDVTRQHFDRLQEHERRVADALAAVLAQHMEAAVQTLEKHGQQTREALIAELRQIGQQLHRMPEIAIRYPEQNGTGANHPQEN